MATNMQYDIRYVYSLPEIYTLGLYNVPVWRRQPERWLYLRL